MLIRLTLFRLGIPPKLDESIKDYAKHSDYFYDYNNTEVLKILGWSGFEEAKDSDWNLIRKIDEIAQRIKRDGSKSVSQELSQLQEIICTN